MDSDDQPSSVLVTYGCQLCGGLIEFERPAFEQEFSQFVECPHCHQETEIQFRAPPPADLSPEPPPIPVPPVLPPRWFGNEQSTVEVHLSSGRQIVIKEILLHNQQDLEHLAALRSQANELFGGAQSQYGFVGDIGWVVGMTTLQNWMLKAESDKLAQAGLHVVEQIRAKENQLRQGRDFFPAGRIENVEHPEPNLWRAETADRAVGFVHNGADFVTIKDAAGAIISVRWSEVAEYQYRLNQL